MDRKSFIKKVAATFLVSIPVVNLWSCSDDSEDMGTGDGGDGGDDVSCVDNGTSTSITDNHGHAISVSKEDVSNGVEKTYDITGTGSHSHTVTVTADNFATLKDNDSVTVESTVSGHSHSITITCA